MSRGCRFWLVVVRAVWVEGVSFLRAGRRVRLTHIVKARAVLDISARIRNRRTVLAYAILQPGAVPAFGEGIAFADGVCCGGA